MYVVNDRLDGSITIYQVYMTHFYIIRHGETVFNRKGRIQGWCDSPLTDLGVSQAKQLGKELKNVPFNVCFFFNE